ncbi:heme oxygenase 1 [Tachyglossus aculeatus]|uniref:heme oxygenase 1 n=1 Tax=Tachyglossus aculeatus TaxID=9261 RepID=UPI0018F754C2|nr:heme oxygenase 1 [Tachyglossus aculeatus]
MDAPRNPQSSQDLSEALKEATKEVHAQAENVEFLKNFQKGQVSRSGFKLVMSSLYHIYGALEEELERHKAHPAHAPVYFPEELSRQPALREDMEYWYGPSWREEIPFPEATRKYVARLRQLGREEPELLVAHAYTRYLGDLSGGQILKKIAQKALHLPGSGEGLAFFSFPAIANATKFKQLYRSRMNSIEMSPETKMKVLEEARASFLFNIRVFEELQELESQSAENDTKQQKAELRKRSNDKVQGSASGKGNEESQKQPHVLSPVPFLRWILTFSFLVATVAVGFYAM